MAPLFQIQSNIPISKCKKLGRWNGIAEKMKEGDSLEVDTRYHAMAFMRSAKKLGLKCVSRQQKEGIIRIWVVGVKNAV